MAPSQVSPNTHGTVLATPKPAPRSSQRICRRWPNPARRYRRPSITAAVGRAAIQKPTYPTSTTSPIGASTGRKVGLAMAGNPGIENGLTVSVGREVISRTGRVTAIATATRTIIRS